MEITVNPDKLKIVEMIDDDLEHICLEALDSEGFIEKGFSIVDATKSLYFIREIGKTKGGNPKVGKRKLRINFCPSCGEDLKAESR